MNHNSPLRYPGGKAFLVQFLEDVIDINDLRGSRYFEPFAGGAGAALGLLERGAVVELNLNDADSRIYSFWTSLLTQSDEFIERVANAKLDISEWQVQHSICANPDKFGTIEVGFAAFYMNRCNRSGVLTGAGPIGGYEQAGQWKLDVRFNKSGLIERIEKILKWRDQISISCDDAVEFLKAKLPQGNERGKAFAYLDPPYVNKGQRLYLNAYDEADHRRLARYMVAQSRLRWIMSYDDSQLIRRLYSSCREALLPVNYSLQLKRTATELIVAPNDLSLPTAFRRSSASDKILRTIDSGGVSNGSS